MFVVLMLLDPVLVVGFELAVLDPAVVPGLAPLPLQVPQPDIAHTALYHLDQVDRFNMSGPVTGGCKVPSAMLTRIIAR